jgi:glycerophosphoryl diester phosphodiesterase
VQCFDPAELHRARAALSCRLPLVQLVDRDRTGAELLTAEGLRRTAEFAQGLGPHYSQLVVPNAATGAHAPIDASPIVGNAHAAGLKLHPYTFRRDDLPAYAPTLEHLLEWFFEHIGVDGVFCDHPDIAVRTRDRVRGARVS